MRKKKASSTIYIIFFFVIFLAFMTFAVDGTIVFSNRLKLQNITETTAIAAASEFKYSLTASTATIETKVSNAANDTFSLLKNDALKTAHINVNVDVSSNKVLVKTTMIAQPFFLRFLGVSGINLEAKACAESKELDVTANYSGINWVSTKAVYLSDIIANTDFHDTAILYPLGNKSSSASYDTIGGKVRFNLVSSADSAPLSLGPGGFIEVKLPAPLVDKPGYDLLVEEAGDAKEGYMVFAGLDNNPKNPYVNSTDTGDGISWINITCSGYSDEITNPFGTAGTKLSVPAQSKIYGSAYFDINNSCITGPISMAKYLRIIDDNDESAFVSYGSNYYKTMIYGEASTSTAGADIYSVQILNHIKLISPSSF